MTSTKIFLLFYQEFVLIVLSLLSSLLHFLLYLSILVAQL